jgi:hypothetical protein
MPMQLDEAAAGSRQNAQFLAVASDLAYLPESEAAPRFRADLGLEAKLISRDNTQAYIAQNPEHLVVVFRGTESPTSIDGLKDVLLTDALNLLIVPEGRMGTDFIAAGVGARFHQGFINALTEIWDPVQAAVEAEQKRLERPLWITGHSLGGALALLAGWLFQRKFIRVHQICTFGAPMIGNTVASQAFDKEFPGQIFRYVNLADPVPKLPTLSLIANEYGHCLTEVPLGTAMGGAGELFGQIASKAVDGLLKGSLIDDVWGVILSRVDGHFIVNYRALIEKKG